MSLSDGYAANHGELGLLGVTSSGNGVYYREATKEFDNRVVIMDFAGIVVETHELVNGIPEAIEYVDAEYGWDEYTELAEKHLSHQ